MDKEFYILRDRFERARTEVYNTSMEFSNVLFNIIKECGIASDSAIVLSSSVAHPLFRITFQEEGKTKCIEFNYMEDDINVLMNKLQKGNYEEL